MGNQGPAGLVRAWIAENKIFILGTIISSTLLELHLQSYHTDPHIEDALDAVVVVATDTGMGTGFFIDKDGCFMTAAHVVAGAQAGHINIRLRGELTNHPAQVVAFQSDMDMAIVCSQTKPKHWLRIANTEDIKRGTHVYALGHPAGRVWNVTDGVVSRTGYKMHNPTGKSWFPRYDLWVSAFISWGNSGGPVIDERGNVVGMIVEWDDPNIGKPNNMNIAIPGTDLLRFIRTNLGR